MTTFYRAETDPNGVLCVDRLDDEYYQNLDEAARLADVYPDTIYFEVTPPTSVTRKLYFVGTDPVAAVRTSEPFREYWQAARMADEIGPGVMKVYVAGFTVEFENIEEV